MANTGGKSGTGEKRMTFSLQQDVNIGNMGLYQVSDCCVQIEFKATLIEITEGNIKKKYIFDNGVTIDTFPPFLHFFVGDDDDTD